MAREQHRRRGMLVLGGLAALGTFVWCAWAFLAGGRSDAWLVALWWASGLGAAALAVAACTVEDDGMERPRYLASILSGLRREWGHAGRDAAAKR